MMMLMQVGYLTPLFDALVFGFPEVLWSQCNANDDDDDNDDDNDEMRMTMLFHVTGGLSHPVLRRVGVRLSRGPLESVLRGGEARDLLFGVGGWRPVRAKRRGV
jgi:hypothetical protein